MVVPVNVTGPVGRVVEPAVGQDRSLSTTGIPSRVRDGRALRDVDTGLPTVQLMVTCAGHVDALAVGPDGLLPQLGRLHEDGDPRRRYLPNGRPLRAPDRVASEASIDLDARGRSGRPIGAAERGVP